MVTFLTVLPRPGLRTQSKVYGGAFLQKQFPSGCFRRAFSHLGDRIKVAGCIRLVVVLYGNDCKGIRLDRLSIGHL